MIVSVVLDGGGPRSEVMEVPVTPHTQAQDILTCCAEPGETHCHLSAVIGDQEVPLNPSQTLTELLDESAQKGKSVHLMVRHILPESFAPVNPISPAAVMHGGGGDGQGRRLMEERDSLRRLRERVQMQEERLLKLRSENKKQRRQEEVNNSLNEELSALRALFSDRERELSLAVARVDQLQQQLGDLKASAAAHRPRSPLYPDQRATADKINSLRAELKAARSSRSFHSRQVKISSARLTERSQRLEHLEQRLNNIRLQRSHGAPPPAVQNVPPAVQSVPPAAHSGSRHRPFTTPTFHQRAPNVAAVEPYVHRPLTPQESSDWPKNWPRNQSDEQTKPESETPYSGFIKVPPVANRVSSPPTHPTNLPPASTHPTNVPPAATHATTVPRPPDGPRLAPPPLPPRARPSQAGVMPPGSGVISPARTAAVSPQSSVARTAVSLPSTSQTPGSQPPASQTMGHFKSDNDRFHTGSAQPQVQPQPQRPHPDQTQRPPPSQAQPPVQPQRVWSPAPTGWNKDRKWDKTSSTVAPSNWGQMGRPQTNNMASASGRTYQGQGRPTGAGSPVPVRSSPQYASKQAISSLYLSTAPHPAARTGTAPNAPGPHTKPALHPKPAPYPKPVYPMGHHSPTVSAAQAVTTAPATMTTVTTSSVSMTPTTTAAGVMVPASKDLKVSAAETKPAEIKIKPKVAEKPQVSEIRPTFQEAKLKFMNMQSASGAQKQPVISRGQSSISESQALHSSDQPSSLPSQPSPTLRGMTSPDGVEAQVIPPPTQPDRPVTDSQEVQPGGTDRQLSVESPGGTDRQLSMESPRTPTSPRSELGQSEDDEEEGSYVFPKPQRKQWTIAEKETSGTDTGEVDELETDGVRTDGVRTEEPQQITIEVSQESDNINPKAARKILKKGSRLGKKHNRRVAFDPLSLLLDASLEGELALVQQTAQLVEDPSVSNDEGITALHNAICAGHLEIVRFLVGFGCNVNAQDSDGWTPLHCAASCNNLPMTQVLVDNGAAILATTLSDQETPAEKCEESEDGFDGCSQYLYGVQDSLGVSEGGLVYALWDYEAEAEDELSFLCGQKMTVLKRGDEKESEWWLARLLTPPAQQTDAPTEGYVAKNLLGLKSRVDKVPLREPLSMGVQ